MGQLTLKSHGEHQTSWLAMALHPHIPYFNVFQRVSTVFVYPPIILIFMLNLRSVRQKISTACCGHIGRAPEICGNKAAISVVRARWNHNRWARMGFQFVPIQSNKLRPGLNNWQDLTSYKEVHCQYNSIHIFLISQIWSDFSEKISKTVATFCLKNEKVNNDGFFAGRGALRGRRSYSPRFPPFRGSPFPQTWPHQRKQHWWEKHGEIETCGNP